MFTHLALCLLCLQQLISTFSRYFSAPCKRGSQSDELPGNTTAVRLFAGLTEEEKVSWTHVWRRLKPWPDSVEGLTRLKKKFTIAPLSNGNVSLLADMAKNAGLPWDLILGAEVARHYKPDREAYLTGCELLSLKPEEVMMTAAHRADLEAARSFGLLTGFIHRPNEYGPARQADAAKPGDFDVVSNDMVDLAAADTHLARTTSCCVPFRDTFGP